MHFIRNALALVRKAQRRKVSVAIGTMFVPESAGAARAVAISGRSLRGKFSKLGKLMDEASNDVPAVVTFPRAHWTQIYSTNRSKGSTPRSSYERTSSTCFLIN